jgi:hypothetical protein
MIRRVFILGFLMAGLISGMHGDLFCEDPPVGLDPGDVFGDPDDDFKPNDLSLSNGLSMGETTSGALQHRGEIVPDPSNDFQLIFWKWILPDPFDR